MTTSAGTIRFEDGMMIVETPDHIAHCAEVNQTRIIPALQELVARYRKTLDHRLDALLMAAERIMAARRQEDAEL